MWKAKYKKSTHHQVSTFFYLVGVTGCGCPVDTSVHSTEAPTEAAAETLNPWPLDEESMAAMKMRDKKAVILAFVVF